MAVIPLSKDLLKAIAQVVVEQKVEMLIRATAWGRMDLTLNMEVEAEAEASQALDTR